jgi:hypothetical protein
LAGSRALTVDGVERCPLAGLIGMACQTLQCPNRRGNAPLLHLPADRLHAGIDEGRDLLLIDTSPLQLCLESFAPLRQVFSNETVDFVELLALAGERLRGRREPFRKLGCRIFLVLGELHPAVLHDAADGIAQDAFGLLRYGRQDGRRRLRRRFQPRWRGFRTWRCLRCRNCLWPLWGLRSRFWGHCAGDAKPEVRGERCRHNRFRRPRRLSGGRRNDRRGGGNGLWCGRRRGFRRRRLRGRTRLDTAAAGNKQVHQLHGGLGDAANPAADSGARHNVLQQILPRIVDMSRNEILQKFLAAFLHGLDEGLSADTADRTGDGGAQRPR